MTELREIEDEMRKHPDPVVTVPELADELDKSGTWVRDQLRLLERAGAVESKDVGARATAWWHEDRVTPRHVAPEDHPDQSDLETVTYEGPEQSVTDALNEARVEAAENLDGPIASGNAGDETDGWTVEQAVASVDLPGYSPKDEDRQNAFAAVLRRLRDTGPTKAQVLQEETHEHHETHYKDPTSWWKNAASPALSELREAGAIELVDRHEGVWAWAGDEDGGRDE